MKKLLVLSTLFAIAPLVAEAGNMFGPAPFRNGSPLVSGVDGTYQATARAQNVTGIFRFAYAGGSQTSTPRQNSWIFFVNGQIYRGNVEANINESSLDGILDSALSSSTTNSDGSISLPYVTISRNENAAGSFQGKLQLKSPSGAFSGQGSLQGLPASTNDVIGISRTEANSGANNVEIPGGSIVVTNVPFTNRASQLPITQFRFRGVRTSTTSSQLGATTTTPVGN